MPFCTSCGTNVEASTAFCTKCGAAMAGAAAASATAAAASAASGAPPKKGTSVLKIILMIVGVFFLLGVTVVGVVIYGAYRVAESVEQATKEGRIETPMGTVETSKDPADAAKDIGVELYPGATPTKDGSSSVTFGGVSATTVVLETSDSPQKVFEFYKAEFPHASMTSSEGDTHTIMSGDKNDWVTVVIAAEGGKTRITIARTSK